MRAVGKGRTALFLAAVAWLALALVAIMLHGCSGTVGGVMTSPTGEPLGAVSGQYHQDGFGGGTLTVTVPDGEVFSGTFEDVKARSTGGGWGWITNPDGTSSYIFTGSHGTTGDERYEAMLIGDAGHSMQCQGRSSFLNCVVSDGRRVDVRVD